MSRLIKQPRRVFLIVLVLLMIVVFLTACSEPMEEAQPIHITFKLPFRYTGSGIFPLHQHYLDAAAGFNELHPYIKVEIVQDGDADIVPYYRRDDERGEDDRYLDLGMLHRGELDLNTELLKLATIDGEMVMLPYTINPYVIFYNKRLLEEAQIPLPESGWTWEQLVEISKQLSPDQKPVLTYSLDTLDLLMTSTAKRGILSPNGTTTVGYLDSPEAVRVMEWLNNYLDHNRPHFQDSLKAFGEFTSSKSALMLNHFFAYSLVRENMSEKEQMQLAPLPYFEGGQRANPAIMEAVAISADTLHPEAAWAFISYLYLEHHEHTVGFADYYLFTSPSMADAMGQSEDPHIAVFRDELDYLAQSSIHRTTHLGEAIMNPEIQAQFETMISVEADKLPYKLERLAQSLDEEIERLRLEEEASEDNK
jgi:ABC-type glycerol-3-phosphate transport system substrate-binding protein